MKTVLAILLFSVTALGAEDGPLAPVSPVALKPVEVGNIATAKGKASLQIKAEVLESVKCEIVLVEDGFLTTAITIADDQMEKALATLGDYKFPERIPSATATPLLIENGVFEGKNVLWIKESRLEGELAKGDMIAIDEDNVPTLARLLLRAKRNALWIEERFAPKK